MHPANINIGTVRSLWPCLWGRYTCTFHRTYR